MNGSFEWLSDRATSDEIGKAKPDGFYAHRYVLAASKAEAIDAALRRVRANLDKKIGWLRDGLATVELQADEVTAAPMHKLLKPDNRGHTFYTEA